MENYILLCVFIMFLLSVFAIADFCVSIIAKKKSKSKLFDYKL